MSEVPLPTPSAPARVCVLLATYNGLPWLDAQLDSILSQAGVEVEVLVSDDGSSDGTRERLQLLASEDPRVRLLPACPRFGSAASNFFHLVRAADTERHALFAFADQDDLWYADKLARHVLLIESEHAEGVSSDVLAFWPSGKTRLIRKARPQRLHDYLLEGPGPGCSFLMRASLVQRCATLLRDLDMAGLEPLPWHDWLAYLVARRSGGRWHIDDKPSLAYRQHARNELGANVGLRAMQRRLAALWRGEYRKLVQRALLCALLIDRQQGRPAGHLRLSALDIWRHGRRRRIDAIVAAAFMPNGVGAALPSSYRAPIGRQPDPHR